MKLQPVILSGGSGTRLWPLSRAMYPKQLLPLVTDSTMIQETALRLTGLEEHMSVLHSIVVCNEEHRFFIAEQLRQINKSPQRILLEPFGRNTAPALTLAALAADPKSVLLVMPADHVIDDESAFHKAVLEGAGLAETGYLVTFGIRPVAAETGYGYIKAGEKIQGDACMISAFVEKPDKQKAETYLQAGGYFWNSGMFLLTAENWLAEIKTANSEMYDVCKKAFEQGEDDKDFYRINKEIFNMCPSDSIDYAVMEKAAGDKTTTLHKAAVVPLDAGWSDVGVWSTLWEVGSKDKQGNVARGDVFLHESENCLVYSSQRHISGLGLKNLIVVETSDAILVADKNETQQVKAIVDWLKINERTEWHSHKLVYRPWGSYETIDLGDRYQVKRITVKPGAALSLQLHHHRAEHWVVVSGTAHVTRGEDEFIVSENESTYIPLGIKHRLENKGRMPLEMIEIQSGSYLGEDDIVRFEDIYGRTDKK